MELRINHKTTPLSFAILHPPHRRQLRAPQVTRAEAGPATQRHHHLARLTRDLQDTNPLARHCRKIAGELSGLQCKEIHTTLLSLG